MNKIKLLVGAAALCGGLTATAATRSHHSRQTVLRMWSKYVWSALAMVGAGGDLTTTVVTAPTCITLVATIGVIITATIATTTTNDDNR